MYILNWIYKFFTQTKYRAWIGQFLSIPLCQLTFICSVAGIIRFRTTAEAMGLSASLDTHIGARCTGCPCIVCWVHDSAAKKMHALVRPYVLHKKLPGQCCHVHYCPRK